MVEFTGLEQVYGEETPVPIVVSDISKMAYDIDATNLDKRARSVVSMFSKFNRSKKANFEYVVKLSIRLEEKCKVVGREDLVNQIQDAREKAIKKRQDELKKLQ